MAGPSISSLFGEDASVLREPNFRLLLWANATYPLGGAVISPILETMRTALSVSPGEAGLLITAFFAPIVVVTPLVGVGIDRAGRKPLLCLGMGLYGVAGLLVPVAPDFGAILGLRLLQGIGAASILPVVVTGIGDLFSGGEEVTAQGIRTTAHAGAAAVFPLAAGLFVIAGWRYPFLLYGVAVGIALLLYLRFEEPPVVGGVGHPFGQLREQLEFAVRPPILGLLVGTMLPPFVLYCFLTYNSIIVLRGLGGTPQEAAVLASIATVASGVAGSQVGRLAGSLGRGTLLVAGNALLGAGLVVAALSPSLAAAAAGVATIGAGFGMLSTVYRSVLIAVTPAAIRGGLVSIGESVRGAGLALPPVVLGVAIDHWEPALGTVRAVRVVNAGSGLLVGLLGVAISLLIAATLPRGE